MTTRLLMTTDAVGGVWTYALDLARVLAPHGFETTLALLGPAATVAQRAEVVAIGSATLVETGLALDWTADDERTVRESARGIARLAREIGADIVQLNQPALAAEPMPAPMVAVVHSCVATWWAAVRGGAMPDDFGWRTALVCKGLARADRIVTPSSAFGVAVRDAYPLPEAPITVHNGRTPIALGHGAPEAAVFTHGRLWDEGKNLATLDAAAALLRVPVRAAGALAGPNGATVALRHIQPLGSLSTGALGERLSRRPIFASAAFYEPFGLAILEAAQAGCPLVLSDIPTFRELWEGAAVFVDARDARGFARAIEAFVDDADLRAAASERARQRAARYTPQVMAAGMRSIFGSLLSPVRAAA